MLNEQVSSIREHGAFWCPCANHFVIPNFTLIHNSGIINIWVYDLLRGMALIWIQKN
jgi:hypothetical protein